jgi:hypothetical protein
MILTVNGVTVQIKGPKSVVIHDRLFDLSIERKDAIVKYLMDEDFIKKGRCRVITTNRL